MTDKISIIIRSKNEERWIGHAIQSVLDKILRPEIIIIDNSSSDRTIEIVKTFIHDPKLNIGSNRNYTSIKIFNIKNYSPGKALNLGAKKAKNSILLFLSSHCVIKNFNFVSIKKNIKKYPAIFGKQIPILDGKKIIPRYIWSHFADKKIVNMYSNMEERYFLHNAFSIFDKKFLLRNPFDEYLTGKEDRYWAREIIKKKKLILYDNSLSCYHHFTPAGNTWKGLD